MLSRFCAKALGPYGNPDGKGYPNLGFVIMNDNQQPVGGDSTIACFSNCGQYEFPVTPAGGQSCSNSDPTCFRWKAFV